MSKKFPAKPKSGAAAALVAAVEAVDFDGPTRGALRTFPRLYAGLVAGKRGVVDQLYELLDRPAAALAAPYLVEALAVEAIDRADLLGLLAHLAAATPARWLGKPLDPGTLWFRQRMVRRVLAARLVEPAKASPVARLLADPDPAIRAASAGLVAWLDPDLVSPVSALLEPLLADPDPAVRAATTLALANLGALDPPALTAALADPEPPVRVCAAVALARRLGPELPDAAVTVLEDDGDAAAVPGFPWYGGSPGQLARAQYLALDPRFGPRVLARAAALLDGPDPWPAAEALLKVAVPGKLRESWAAPLPDLDPTGRVIVRLIAERPALLDAVPFRRFAQGRCFPIHEIPLRQWVGLPLVTPRWFPVRRAVTLGADTREVAVWLMEHADGAVPDSEALALAIADALDTTELARVVVSARIETESTAGAARTRPIPVPVIAPVALPADEVERAAAIEAAVATQIEALVADGWDAGYEGGHLVATRPYQRARIGAPYDWHWWRPSGSAWWTLRPALVRLGARRSGFLAAALASDPEEGLVVCTWVLAATGEVPPAELDGPIVALQRDRGALLAAIPTYLQHLAPDRREAAVLGMLARAHDNRRSLIELVRRCRTERTVARAVEVFASGLSWSGGGLDEREASLLARAAGAAAIPHLEELATRSSHARIALAIERCRAAT